MERQERFDPIETIIARLVESSVIIAPVFQAQYNGVKDELGYMFTKAGRNMYSRMRRYW